MTYWGYLIGFGYIALLLAVGELLAARTRCNREVLRKCLHCLIGGEWFVLYYCFGHSWQIVVIPICFVVLNTIVYKTGILRSVNRQNNNHAGTVYYALAMTAMSIACAINEQWLIPFGIAVACLSWGDGAAAIAGRYIKPRLFIAGNKTLFGAIGCFVFAFAAQIAFAFIVSIPLHWAAIATIACVAALAECLCGKGLDNLFVCLWCCLFAYAFYIDTTLLSPIGMGFCGYLVLALTYELHLFTLPAALCAGVMLVTVGLCGGWWALALILSSFVLIAAMEGICKRIQSNRMRTAPARHVPRTVFQVLQNGGWATVCIIVYRLYAHPALLAAFAVGIAQSLGDSAASAVGVLSAKPARSILTGQAVNSGESGGVTLLGCIACLIATLPPVLLCGPLAGWGWYLLPVWALPTLGMLLDSVLGCTAQSKFRCPVCGKVTDKRFCCGRPCEPHGKKGLSNGGVNLVCNGVTTVTALLIFWFWL